MEVVMSDVEVVQCQAHPTAVYKASTVFPELSATIRKGMDTVYALLPSLNVAPHGHNVVVYKGSLFPGPAPVEVGVLVARDFDKTGDVEPSALPAGEAIRTVHVGPYFEMRRGYERLEQWMTANGRKRTNLSWEVYGDWNEDESKLETELYIQLQP
jgi:effector-binding domain-containing protein